jgi:hypothetical protein
MATEQLSAERKPNPTWNEVRLLPMQRQVGDCLVGPTGVCEIVEKAYTMSMGKTVHARVRRADDMLMTLIPTAMDRATGRGVNRDPSSSTMLRSSSAPLSLHRGAHAADRAPNLEQLAPHRRQGDVQAFVAEIRTGTRARDSRLSHDARAARANAFDWPPPAPWRCPPALDERPIPSTPALPPLNRLQRASATPRWSARIARALWSLSLADTAFLINALAAGSRGANPEGPGTPQASTAASVPFRRSRQVRR